MQDLYALAIGVGIGLLIVVGALASLRHYRVRPATGAAAEIVPKAVFLMMQDGSVLDATQDARDIIGGANIDGATWQDLHAVLVPRFPDLPITLPSQSMAFQAEDGSDARLEFEPEGPKVRLLLSSSPMGPGAQHRLLSQADDLVQLSSVIDLAPNPIWSTDKNDALLWSNAAYERLRAAAEAGDAGSPIFDLDLGSYAPSHHNRTRIETRDGVTHWFEVTSQKSEEGWAHFATDIDTLIEAELAQRNFVQTLTKTFAHLPIGLAVFDRDRRLVLFNPALVDLTRLPVDFLSARPNLLSFFDHMRDNRMMPEPKNYATWREQLTDVIAAARDDRYCETWSLASGLTYKITGRPHPDGAVAFLLEDISAEISLTRRFRSELELTQSVIDCIQDAVAVFSRLGVLTFSNSAYRELWNCDPDSAFAEMTIAESTRDWKDACASSQIWGEVRDFVLTMQDRNAWDASLHLRDGRGLQCWIVPVSAGATMVRFAVTSGKSEPAEAPQLVDKTGAATG